MKNIFKSIAVGKSIASSRISLPPLTRLRAPDHIPHTEVVEYYGRCAASAPGTLLVAEATIIAPETGGYEYVPGIYNQQQINAWRKVTNEVHKHNSPIYLQLWALGRQAYPKILEKEGPYPFVAPSAIAAPGATTPRPLSTVEITGYIQWYAQAAKNAIEAGFDGIELHGANGYLIDQFLHESTNNRTDQYGGSIENRARFPLQVIDKVVEAIGPDCTAIRLSPWGLFGGMDYGTSPIPQWSYLVSELETRAQAGNRISYISLMEPRMDLSEKYTKVPRHLNNFVRDIWKGVIVRAGGFGRDLDEMIQLTEQDNQLLLAVGRLFISNPDLVNKLKNRAQLDGYNRATFYWNGKYDPAEGYTRNYTKD